MKIRNFVDLFTILPKEEKIIVDVLRQTIIESLPEYCKEKISYNVPFFYGNKAMYYLAFNCSEGRDQKRSSFRAQIKR
jgi:uncharacterized protein YdhG (YjbR/CyaY superfamily)